MTVVVIPVRLKHEHALDREALISLLATEVEDPAAAFCRRNCRAALAICTSRASTAGVIAAASRFFMVASEVAVVVTIISGVTRSRVVVVTTRVEVRITVLAQFSKTLRPEGHAHTNLVGV